MAASSNTAHGGCRVPVRPDSASAARVRPAGVPACYLGRPAHLWLAVFRPHLQHGAWSPDDASGVPGPRVHRGSPASLASDPDGDGELPRGLGA